MPIQAPTRPTLMVVDPDTERRHTLAVALSEESYEVVPTISAEEGLRFAQALGPAVIVAPVALPGFADGTVTEELRRAGQGARTMLLLGETEAEGEELAEDLLYLPTAGLSAEELVRRVRLVLVGHELGIEPDPGLEALVGSLDRLPPLELVRSLARLEVSCRLALPGVGSVALGRGQVVAAEIGAARGVKAFCRFGRRREGPFRLFLEPAAVGADDPAAVVAEVTPLIIEALEDVVPGAPADRLRLRRLGAPERADDVVRDILSLTDVAAAEGQELTVGELLDQLFYFKDGEIHAALLALREQGALDLVEPRAPVRVVTDSTSDLPRELAADLGIAVVPLRVYFGQEIFRDGIEVTPASFYELLTSRRDVHPSTSPPPAIDFVEAYSGLIASADIVSVHISSRMSLTFEEANKALASGAGALAALRREGEAPRVEVVDSRSVSLGLGLLALFAARLAERGWKASAIAERLGAIRQRLHVLFVVDTLEYLARGGRIGRARALVGSLLGIKPILGVVDGEVAAVDRVRGGRRAHPKMLELFRERVDPARPVLGGVAHANAPMWADRLRSLLAESLDARELLMAEIGPVVGTHAGPGMVGAALYQPVDDEELALLSPAGARGA